MRGNHVIRKLLPENFSKMVGVGWSCSGGNAIRYQRFVALVLLNHNHSISEAGILRECMFDFSQLDAEAAQLDLVVCAPDVLNIAVTQPAAQVAGAIHAGTCFAAKWVIQKALMRQ